MQKQNLNFLENELEKEAAKKKKRKVKMKVSGGNVKKLQKIIIRQKK